jgi:rubrerythrin
LPLHYCKYCGFRIEDLDDQYCANCGKLLRLKVGIDLEPSSKGSSDWITRAKARFTEVTKPKVESTRAQVLEGLDKLIRDIGDSTTYRATLAKMLANLKEKIAGEPVMNHKLGEKISLEDIIMNKSVSEEQANIIGEELLIHLQKDRCIVCYGSLNQNNSINVLICPKCGQGGHENHLQDYLSKKEGQCPVCREKTAINNYFRFILKPNPLEPGDISED